ncbi:MAG: insulinase family protein [Deltaproteobacteria bacterium]|nr:insulinase family protein [Deltaproteobacteria bacterium]
MKTTTRVVLPVLLAFLPFLRASAATSAVTEARFGNGMKVLLLEDHKLPTIYFGLMFRAAGAAMDPPGKTGVASLTAELLREGTKTRSSKDISQAVDFMGASLGAGADHDRATASAAGLTRDTPAILDLLADVVLRPAFKAEDFDRVKGLRLAALQQQLDDADGLARRAFNRFLFGKHAYALPAEGTVKTVTAITREDVAAFHAAHYRADNAVLVIAGDFTAAQVLPLVESALSTFKPGTAEPPVPAPGAPATAARILLLDKPDLTQAKMTFGHLGIARTHPDYYPALVMNGVLGGAGFLSRLTMTVRTKMGLTYGIGSYWDARVAGGGFAVSCSTRTEQAVEAIRATVAEMDRLAGGGATPRELADVQGYLAGAFSLAIETPEAQAGYLLSAELFGLGTDFLRTHPQKIREVTAKDVSRAAGALIGSGLLRYVVVGKAEALKEPLSQLGTVELRAHKDWADEAQ